MVAVPDYDGEAYQARFDALAAEGLDVHGEAAFVRSFGPASVLDAGCGTGRVAVELARHGIDVVGVDIDESMIGAARRRAPALGWVHADMASADLGRRFDAVVLAGNVPIFCATATRPALIRACAAHVAPGGVLIAGFQLDRGYGLDAYDLQCQAAGLTAIERWATWDRRPFTGGEQYAVSVHRR